MPERCTTSRANDFATLSHFLLDWKSQNIGSTKSLTSLTNFEVDVAHRVTFWCWRIFFILSKTTSPKRKNRKVKNLSHVSFQKNFLFLIERRK